MFGLGKFFRKGAGVERHYGPVYVHGEPMRCVVCRHGEFWEHNVQLHTPAASFFNVEFVNRVAHCAVCASCGYVHFFIPTHTAPAASGEGG
jgi:hypothetical protein